MPLGTSSRFLLADIQEMELRDAALQYVAVHFHRLRVQRPADSSEALQHLATSYPDVMLRLMDEISAAVMRRLGVHGLSPKRTQADDRAQHAGGQEPHAALLG